MPTEVSFNPFAAEAIQSLAPELTSPSSGPVPDMMKYIGALRSARGSMPMEELEMRTRGETFQRPGEDLYSALERRMGVGLEAGSQSNATAYNQRAANYMSFLDNSKNPSAVEGLLTDPKFAAMPLDFKKKLVFLKGGQPALDKFSLEEDNKIKRAQAMEDYTKRMALRNEQMFNRKADFPIDYIEGLLKKGDIKLDPSGKLLRKDTSTGVEQWGEASQYDMEQAIKAWPVLHNKDFPLNQEQQMALQIGRENPNMSIDDIKKEVAKRQKKGQQISPTATSGVLATLQKAGGMTPRSAADAVRTTVPGITSGAGELVGEHIPAAIAAILKDAFTGVARGGVHTANFGEALGGGDGDFLTPPSYTTVEQEREAQQPIRDFISNLPTINLIRKLLPNQ